MYKIYWTSPGGEVMSLFKTDLSEALDYSRYARESGGTFVCMVSKNPNQVGKSGVDAVVDGKLPDGHDYTWMKRRT
jgi:hypothetical protein